MDVILRSESSDAGSQEAGMARYLREVGRSRLLSRIEEKNLLDRIGQGDRAALNSLVTANLKWVVAVSGEYRERGLPMTDLIAEGNLGLIRAAMSFDPDHAFRFTAYAIWWIRQSLERALADLSRFQGIEPAVEPEPECDSGSDSKTEVPDNRLSPALRRALEEVREPGKTIIKLFFGVDTRRPMSLEEIGHLLGTAPARTRQLKDMALRRLQKAIPATSAPDQANLVGA